VEEFQLKHERISADYAGRQSMLYEEARRLEEQKQVQLLEQIQLEQERQQAGVEAQEAGDSAGGGAASCIARALCAVFPLEGRAGAQASEGSSQAERSRSPVRGKGHPSAPAGAAPTFRPQASS
jgi:hypothetical protein